ncbi:MAG: hypothetical protein KC656_35870, partial [Myxococcales bacterium]|nr:hypothetical protein [Myxococcales bacterium]
LNEVHLDPVRVEGIRQAFLATYPVSPDRLEIEIRPTYLLDASVPQSCNVYDEQGNARPGDCVPAYALLDQLLELHVRERPGPNTVYLGLFSYDPQTHGTEDDIAGVAGGTTVDELLAGAPMAAVASYPDDLDLEELYFLPGEDLHDFADMLGVPARSVEPWRSYLRYADEYYTTMLHEVGHTLSFLHVPTPGSPFPPDDTEPGYPRADGSIGLPGYDVRRDHDLMGAYTHHFMSYSLLTWISDHSARRVHEVLTMSGARKSGVLEAGPHVVGLVHLGDDPRGRLTWHAPHGPSAAHPEVEVRALDAAGRLLDTVSARLVRFSHGRAGQL